MKKLLILSILFIVGCAADVAPVPEVPPAVVTGAEKPVPIGELVTLTIAPNIFPSDIINVHYEWKVIDSAGTKKVWLSDNNQSVSFGTGPVAGKITAILDPTYVYGDSKTKVVADVKSAGISVIEVQVGDSPPTPDPIPVPPSPIPTPPAPVPVVIPDGQFKLAKIVYDGLLTNKSTNKEFLSSLSAVYKTVSQQVRAGVLTNLKDSYALLKKSNQDVFTKFGENTEGWKGLDDAVTASVYQLYTDKRLPTLLEYATAWTEISAGFDLYISNLK